MTPIRRWVVALSVAALAVAAGCTANTPPDGQHTEPEGVDSEGVLSGVDAQSIPAQEVSPQVSMRLGDGLLPPTNRWFSGLVFGDEPQPVFTGPLSFAPTDSGFAVGVPQVSTSAETIAGPASTDVVVDVGTTDLEVSAYDDASLALTLSDGDQTVGTAHLASGSGAVGFVAEREVTVRLGVIPSQGDDGQWMVRGASGRTYLLGTDGEVTGDEVILAQGQVLSVLAVPDDAPPLRELNDAAGAFIASTQTDFGVADSEITTDITYTSGSGAVPLIARMPHQGAQCEHPVGTYPSVYGQLQACLDADLSWTVPRQENPFELDLSDLNREFRQDLIDQVRTDAANAQPYPADTYFGGKALARDATLMMLADQLDLTEEANELASRISTELEQWATADACQDRDHRCFVYDPQLAGVVGMQPSFGSEEFNDHHFHYGSFLYAAALLVNRDESLAPRLQPVMDLLAADIASAAPGEDFVRLRAFDVYRGHSWASGLSPFADGNNQESASEAVSAWAALDLWARATDQQALAREATWLTSLEAHSALSYWTNPDLSDPVYNGFDAPITSLNWGGKRDYATWFSPEPSAKLGILVLPLRPVGTYLGEDPERINQNLDFTVGPDSDYDVMFGDYLLMYRALAGPDEANRALEIARALPADRIDDGNTASYLLAWIMTRTG